VGARVSASLLLLGCLLAPPLRAADLAPERLSIPVRERSVTALLLRPAGASALLVLAHGQAMDLEHPFMASLSAALAERGVATLRFNFPYAEDGRKRLDPHPVLIETVRAAVRAAGAEGGALPLLLGGKSIGGGVAAMATQDGALAEVRGLVVLGFPLHAPNRPSAVNARQLEKALRPLLVVQGSRDPLAQLVLMEALVEKLGDGASLHVVRDADHGFELPEGSRRSPAAVHAEIADAVAAFTKTALAAGGG
jgi:hypothetical protein